MSGTGPSGDQAERREAEAVQRREEAARAAAEAERAARLELEAAERTAQSGPPPSNLISLQARVSALQAAAQRETTMLEAERRAAAAAEGERRARADAARAMEQAAEARREAAEAARRTEALAKQLAELQAQMAAAAAPAGGGGDAAAAGGARAPIASPPRGALPPAFADTEEAWFGSPPPISRGQGPMASGNMAAQIKLDMDVRVEKLTPELAQQQRALLGWIFDMENWFDVYAAATHRSSRRELRWDEMLAQIRRMSHRDMWLWWKTREEAAAQGARTAVTTWDEFVVAIQQDFAPVSDENKAIELLWTLRQRQGESMQAYLLRAAELRSRIRKERLQSSTLAERVLAGVDQHRYSIGYLHVCGKQKEELARTGQGLSFELLRHELQTATAAEEERWARSGGGGSTEGARRKHVAAAARNSDEGEGGDPGWGPGTGAASNRDAEVAELRRQVAALSAGRSRPTPGGTGGEGKNRSRSNSADGRGQGGRCFRCGERSHVAVDCSHAENVCWNCKRAGHTRQMCPDRKGGGKGGGGGSGGSGGVNWPNTEGRSTSSSSSKNE